jgi:hypothetical protein
MLARVLGVALIADGGAEATAGPVGVVGVVGSGVVAWGTLRLDAGAGAGDQAGGVIGLSPASLMLMLMRDVTALAMLNDRWNWGGTLAVLGVTD